MTDTKHTVSRRIGWAWGIFIGAYIVFEQLLLPVFRPLSRLLVKLPPVLWIDHTAARLPPTAALVALAIPLLIAEPAKWFGLYLIADEKVMLGVTVIILAYLISLLIVDRIYEAAKPNLLTIAWFAKVMGWLTAMRDAMMERLRNAGAGRWIRAKVKAIFGEA